MYVKMINYRTVRGFKRRVIVDRCNSKFIVLANFVLLSYLMFEPSLLEYCGDAFIVINIFYNAYLITASLRVFGWWRSKTIREHKQANLVDHMLT